MMTSSATVPASTDLSATTRSVASCASVPLSHVALGSEGMDGQAANDASAPPFTGDTELPSRPADVLPGLTHETECSAQPLLAMAMALRVDEQQVGAQLLSRLSWSEAGKDALATQEFVDELAQLVQQLAPHVLQGCVFAVVALANLSERVDCRRFIARTGILQRLLRFATCSDPHMKGGVRDLELRRECVRTAANVASSHPGAVASSYGDADAHHLSQWLSQARFIADDRLRTHALRLESILRL